TPQPQAMADFYQATYAMRPSPHGEATLCHGPGRELGLSPGPANQLCYALYRFASHSHFQAFHERVGHLAVPTPAQYIADTHAPEDVITLVDPDGNHIVFVPPDSPLHPGPQADVPAAGLQHFALRT